MFKYYLLNTLRHFRRHWVTSSVNVVGLALGFVCFVAAISAIRYFELDDQHFPGADHTHFVTRRPDLPVSGRDAMGFPQVPWIAAEHIRSNIPELEAVARVTESQHQSVVSEGKAFDVRASYADAEFFKLFPLAFLEGNGANALASPRSAIVTDEAANRIFGTVRAVGRSLLVEGRDFITITGVVSLPSEPSHIVRRETPMSKGFEMLVSMDVILTAAERDSGAQRRLQTWQSSPPTTTYIRLPANGAVTLSAVVDRMNKIAQGNGRTKNDQILGTMPLNEFRQRSSELTMTLSETPFKWSTLLLLFAGTILLVSCLNYANLSTATSTAHAKEFGVRRVLGATAAQLFVQHIIDAGVVVLGALTIAFVARTMTAQLALQTFDFDPVFIWTHDFSFWAQMAGVTLGAVLFCSAIPAVTTHRAHLAASLQRSRGGAGTTTSSRWLVGAQFFVAGTLLIFSLVFQLQHREVMHTARTNLPESVVAITNNLKQSGVDLQTLRAELLLRPNVESVSASNITPWGPIMTLASYVRTPDAGSTPITAMTHFVDRNFFSTMGITTLSGPLFDEQDDPTPGSGYRSTMVIDRTMAAKLGFASPQDAIGKLLYQGRGDRSAASRIVGVVEDKLLAVAQPFKDFASTAYVDAHGATRVPLVKLKAGRLRDGFADVQAVWSELAPNFVLRTIFVDEAIETYSRERQPFVSLLGGLTFGSLAIAMAGFLGMSIYMANRRRHEIGVRKTLGARTAQVVKLLLKDLSKPVLIGSILAWPVAYLLGHAYLEKYAHPIDFSPLFFVGSLIATLCISSVVISWCVVRSAQTNPSQVLRHE